MKVTLDIDWDDVAELEAARRTIAARLRDLDSPGDPAPDATTPGRAAEGLRRRDAVVNGSPDATPTELAERAMRRLLVGEETNSRKVLLQALRNDPATPFTLVQLADQLGVSEGQIKAYRRNLGRAMRPIVEAIPGLPDLFESEHDGVVWRYRVHPTFRAAAAGLGLDA